MVCITLNIIQVAIEKHHGGNFTSIGRSAHLLRKCKHSHHQTYKSACLFEKFALTIIQISYALKVLAFRGR